jgi:protocatechuate 3,4-dioxygenase beta subunit
MFKFIQITFLITSFFSSHFASFAKTPEEVRRQYENITPIINIYKGSDFRFNDPRLGRFTSNDLTRKTGSAIFAIGEPLVLFGVVRDINNVPIDGVKVEIIQANSNGAYNHMIGQNSALYDSNFAGSGISITDNNGEYAFITVFPGHYNDRAPHIHIRLTHPQHGQIETEIFFQNHERNTRDPKYKKLSPQKQNLITGMTYYSESEEGEEPYKIVEFNIIFNTNQSTKSL